MLLHRETGLNEEDWRKRLSFDQILSQRQIFEREVLISAEAGQPRPAVPGGSHCATVGGDHPLCCSSCRHGISRCLNATNGSSALLA
jgi:hypothetical protein